MKKVLTVIPTLTGGGAERVCLRLHELFLERGVDSHIIVLSEKVTYDCEELPNIHILPNKNVRNLDLFGKAKFLSKLLEKKIYDLTKSSKPFAAIYSHLDESNVVVRKLGLDIPTFYVVHSSIKGELDTARNNNFIKYLRLKAKKKALNGQSIIAVSEGVKQDLLKISWLKNLKVKTIYNPINIDRVQVLSKEELTSELLPEGPFLLHIGRFAKAKRHDVLLDAFKDLLQLKPKIKLVLLVNPDSKIKSAIASRGLIDHVVLPGFTNNPFSWMKQASLVILSSSYEGFPNVLVESIICGTPFVSTDCDHGPREIVKDYAESWLVPPNSPLKLSSKINALMNHLPPVEPENWPLLHKVKPDFAVDGYLGLIDKE
ncbi:glycosyltransferase [Idiomarina loihiensis]|uniref:glycosyltransferase n=1 Tax=Idiomarina loihiensis TaxID=135577 RepID=UPI00384EFF7F